MPDYIPGGEGEFFDWAANFVTVGEAEATDAGFSAAQITALKAKHGAWLSGRIDRNAKQSVLDGAVTATQQLRDDLTSTVRGLVGDTQRHLGTNDALRRRLKIPVAGDSAAPTGPAATWPVFTVTSAGHLRLEAAFRDSATPGSRAKPAGMLGAEVWLKVGGAAPTQESETHFLGLDTKTPYLHEFEPGELGQPAHIRGRWISSKGEKGPWGPVATAIVGG